MSDFITTYFGPLDVSACLYFRILTIFFFGMLVFALFTELIFVVKNYRNLNLRIFLFKETLVTDLYLKNLLRDY